MFFVSLLELIYNIIAFVCSNIEGWFYNSYSTILQFDAKYLQLNVYFSIQLPKNCNYPPHQSLTSNNNSPSSPAMGLEPMTPGLPAQCLIHSSTRSLIEKHENLPILTHIRLCNLMQVICNWNSVSQFRHKIFVIENLFFNPDTKKLQTCHRNIGFCKNYAKKLQSLCKICVETQNINNCILSEILLQKLCVSIKNICILQRFLAAKGAAL